MVSSVIPQCSSLGGDLYILTGAGGLGAAEDGNKDCLTEPLWSAVCCAAPEGKGGFSVGLIKETEELERQVSVKELEEILGVAELFSEDCGGAEEKTVDLRVGLPGKIGELEADANAAEAGSDTTGQDAREHITESREATQEQVAGADAQTEKTGGADVAKETSADAVSTEGSSDKLHDVAHSGADRSESPESSGGYDSVDDTNSTSALFYIISTTFSILKAPLHPVFSTVTQLPGQVMQLNEPFKPTLFKFKQAILRR